jgi:hypothetical protein
MCTALAMHGSFWRKRPDQGRISVTPRLVASAARPGMRQWRAGRRDRHVPSLPKPQVPTSAMPTPNISPPIDSDSFAIGRRR